MFEVKMHTGNNRQQCFCVRVNEFNNENLHVAQDLALRSGYDPSRPGRMTEQGGAIKWYASTQDGIRQLFNGKFYYKLYASLDNNGNRIAKVFYMDGTSEIIKDARLPLHSDKSYKSISGLHNSR